MFVSCYIAKQPVVELLIIRILQAFVPPKDLQEAVARLEAAEEKAAEVEFLRLALKEKMPEKQLDDTAIKLVI